jgi:hypothetical protein
MNENLIDPTCIDTTKYPNRSSYPIGSAQHLDPNYNILPFLCDLLTMATDPNATGLLTDPVTPFDITPFTDFSPLTAVGDPRVSLGETMTQTFVHFLPRMITQTEVRQNGGSQVIDNYICTADGTPIKISESINALLSLDLTGQKPYQYGAITVPPVTQTMEELMKPFDASEVINFVKTYVSNAKDACASDFVAFINKYFLNYNKQVDVYQSPSALIVTLSNNSGKLYVKYYVDVGIKVGCLLGLGTITQHSTLTDMFNVKLAFAASSNIPNYKSFLTDTKAADDYYSYLMTNFFDDGSTTYNSTGTFEERLNQINTFVNSVTSKQIAHTSTPVTVSCASV